MNDQQPQTPTQNDVLERIRVPVERRPSYRSTLKMDLRNDLERDLVNIADNLSDVLFVSKRRLAAVHACEAHHLAEQRTPFEWSIPLARGSVSHKAIELSMHLAGQRDPGDLVDEAVAILIDRQTRIGDFLSTCGETSRAELRSESSAMVSSFLDTFPTLRKGWRPATEGSKRVELCQEKITLSGKFDLTIGMPNDTTAGRVIVDVKTGGFAPEHREDLRFYALIETLVTGVPPLLVATHYIESGRMHEEAITEDVLNSAVRRTTDGIIRLSQLENEDVEPVRKPGAACRWCPISDDCTPGTAWLNDSDGW